MPIVIVEAFLLLTLVVRIYFSRKKTTFREYSVGNKDFATAALVATVLATYYGGNGLLHNVAYVYELSLFWIMIKFFNCFSYWIMSRFVLRMGRFMKHISMAETIGSIYGTYPGIVTALVSIFHATVIITMQIIVMSKLIQICLNSIDPFVITIFSTLLLIFYSTFGGARAVTYIDILQFITFPIIISLLCGFMFVKVGKPVSAIVPILGSQTKFQFSKLFDFSTQMMDMLLLGLSVMVPYGSPGYMQRIYMASGPIQAQKVFAYTALFSCIIQSFIILTSLFVFAGAPDLPTAAVLDYIMAHIPAFFKGLLTIGLLAMTMSTVDSALNACSVIFSNDILQFIKSKKEISDAYKLKIARRTTLVLGLLAMLIAFKCPKLLKLFYWSFDYSRPIMAAPFILAIFGFRGTARTALTGMVTGLLSILTWNQWIHPSIGINGAFIAILANGLSMMAAHYLLKQPKSASWVKPDNVFKQMQQERARKRAERKESIKNAWANRKITLSKLIPSGPTLHLTGAYMITTAILSYWYVTPDCIHWAMCQIFVSALFTSFKIFFSKVLPSWFISLGSLVALAVYLPLNLLWCCWHMVDPIFSVLLSLTHCAVILWVLPLYLSIWVVATTWSVALIAIGQSFPVLSSLFPLLLASLFVFSIIIHFRVKVGNLTTQNIYLKDQERIRESQQLKASLYNAYLVPSNGSTPPKGYGFILNQVVRKVEESISFLDNHTPLFKEDFQSIFNKLYDWVSYFNRKEKAKDHALLQPTKITLDKLMRKVEIDLSQQMNDPPRLLVEKISSPNQEPYSDIVCDVSQVVYSLVKTVLRIGKLEGPNAPIVSIQLHPTALQFKQADSIDNSFPSFMNFQATALIFSQSTTASESLPKVKECYDETDAMDPQGQKNAPPSIDLEQDTISSMVRSHYGYLEASTDQKQPTMLLVLPSDVTAIRDKMTAKLPIDSLTIEVPVTPKEQADSMMELMKFHDHVCKSLYQDDPIDAKTISGLLLLLSKHFRFKRHVSGQLFYVRAVGIAKLVVDWVFHSPKVIYASLLYGLVHRTCLPLSYIKEHYNLGVYAFVSNLVKVDKREELDHPSLLYVQNRLEQAIKEDHVQLSVLFIKLAERIYDLRHAAGYIHLTEVQHMAQETLNIDVQIANAYLGPEIGQALEEAALAALEVYNSKEKEIKK